MVFCGSHPHICVAGSLVVELSTNIVVGLSSAEIEFSGTIWVFKNKMYVRLFYGTTFICRCHSTTHFVQHVQHQIVQKR